MSPVPKRDASNGTMDLTLPAEEIYTPENIRPTGFQLEEKTRIGTPLTPVEIHFTRGEERYPSFTLHRGTRVEATTADGTAVELRFLGSLVELDGAWKILSNKD